MPLIRVLSAIACCLLLATCNGEEIEAVPTKVADKVEAIATTKLTPSIEEDAKSKTEKRDSSDQTGAPYLGLSSKEPPFRPIYPPRSLYEAEAPTPIFGPTTLRYTAAEAAPQVPLPQAFHGQKAPPHHRFSFAVPPQVEPYQRQTAFKPVVAPPQPHPQPQTIFNYGELEPEAGATAPLGHLHHHHPHYSNSNSQQGKYLQQPQQKLQQRIQYIIAIPLSYMRQLQQQQQLHQQQQQQQQQLLLAPPPTSSSSTTTTSSAAPPSASPQPAPTSRHPLMQLLGPLARDHQGQYRPYYQSDAASAPLAGPTAPLIHQPYLQIPTSLLMAAAQQLQQHHHQQQQQQQAAFAKVAAPPPTYQTAQPAQLIYQPAPSPQAHHHQPQIQLQLQRVFLQPPQPQQSTIYAEQPGPLYAYPLQQQYQKPHQQQSLKQSQQQQQKYTPAAPTAPTAPTALTTTSTTSTAATATAEAAASATAASIAARQQHLPVVHYNPIYVQAPAEQQQQQQQQHQFAILPRFSNNNPKAAYNMVHESAGPIHVVRLSPANGPPIHHYHHYQPASVLQPLYSHAPQQYVSPYVPAADGGAKSQGPDSGSGSGALLAGPTPAPIMTAASPAIIPYFSHPGAVHYGTHLYQPGAATALGASATSGAGAAGPRAAGLKQQSTATSGGQLPGDSNNIVKYP
ncbi:putative uncharacterized protein DDB_G0291608 [Drosophila rhopaloa]|uniref:Uncharacterized protein n=1 Tax=Drosophila rhopaloa TaxID=1041015 RepID=A0ABM5JEP9_DRORH|nr:putative uncharacterized protein DDB_G0291608 [Drosophila rhopaloa]